MGDSIDYGNASAACYLNAALSKLPVLVPNAVSICIDCDDAIDACRKQAVPSTKHCSECQQYFDKQHHEGK
ncbi:TraR/DksA C4-type zinc finger protein [Psychrobacter pygoscelis]|uniref:TraR/DksA C4-type zinc finger protein n=1 Tax=Psychrobacter pygoscelis TaxID=2488563 RepID=UPI0013F3D9CB|nr:TraR/DksA C4-type zinc finger protein [Psychrobacter pygoscelis]